MLLNVCTHRVIVAGSSPTEKEQTFVLFSFIQNPPLSLFVAWKHPLHLRHLFTGYNTRFGSEKSMKEGQSTKVNYTRQTLFGVYSCKTLRIDSFHMKTHKTRLTNNIKAR